MDPDNCEELFRAVKASNIERVRELYVEGVSLTTPDPYGWLPVHRAAVNDRNNIISLLIQWGSPLDAKGGIESWTPLHLACASGNCATATALIKAGADVAARTIFRDTPLHLAITGNRPEIVRALLAAGAKVDVQNEKGTTPLEKARAKNRTELERLLEEG